MEQEDSLPRSQEPATSPYPERDESVLKMETLCFSETLICSHESTRRYNQERHLCRCENQLTLVRPISL
jgi:hypothetical protein